MHLFLRESVLRDVIKDCIDYLVFTVFSTVTFALTNDDLSLHQYRGHIIKNNGEYQTDIDQVYIAELLEGQFTHG
jgi:hypothetical protein